MTNRTYYSRLLIVAGIFIVFFALVNFIVGAVQRYLPIDPGSRNGMLTLSVIQQIVCFILPAYVASSLISKHPWGYMMLRNKTNGMQILGVVFAFLIALPALNQIVYWNANIVFPDVIAHWGETMKAMEESVAAHTAVILNITSWEGLIINLLVVGCLPAFAEELFFRGTLQRTAGAIGAHHTSIWVVALFFSAMHLQFFGFIPRLLLGAFFGYLLYWTKSLYVPIIAHFINNGVVVAAAWLTARGYNFDIQNFGVCEYGFPLAAFVSAVATVVFLVYFRGFFFMNSQRDNKYQYA